MQLNYTWVSVRLQEDLPGELAHPRLGVLEHDRPGRRTLYVVVLCHLKLNCPVVSINENFPICGLPVVLVNTVAL